MSLFFSIIAALLILISGIYWHWRQKIMQEIAEGAAIEWAYLQANEPEFISGISEKQFREIYLRVHMPRFPAYALAALISFFATLPVTFGALTLLLWIAGKTGLLPEPVEVADRLILDDGNLRFFRETPPEAALYYVQDLAGFYYFFGTLFVWLAIVMVFMRRFHARRPGYLRDEIIRARD